MSNRIIRDLYGMTLVCYEAGQYVDEQGSAKDYRAGIKLKATGSEVRITALQLAALLHAATSDAEVSAFLAEKLKAEKESILRVEV